MSNLGFQNNVISFMVVSMRDHNLEVLFKMSKTTPMVMCRNSISSRHSLGPGHAHLFYNGREIDLTQSPSDLNIIDGSTLEWVQISV